MGNAGSSTNAPAPGVAYEYNENVVRQGLSKRRQFAWLDRSQYWPEMPLQSWVPRKVFGMSTYGLCGLWDYTGNEDDKPKQIAVK